MCKAILLGLLALYSCNHAWEGNIYNVTAGQEGLAQKALCEAIRDHPANRDQLVSKTLDYSAGNGKDALVAIGVALNSYHKQEWNELNCSGYQWNGVKVGAIAELMR